jgi:hypothetical protein
VFPFQPQTPPRIAIRPDDPQSSPQAGFAPGSVSMRPRNIELPPPSPRESEPGFLIVLLRALSAWQV